MVKEMNITNSLLVEREQESLKVFKTLRSDKARAEMITKMFSNHFDCLKKQSKLIPAEKVYVLAIKANLALVMLEAILVDASITIEKTFYNEYFFVHNATAWKRKCLALTKKDFIITEALWVNTHVFLTHN